MHVCVKRVCQYVYACVCNRVYACVSVCMHVCVSMCVCVHVCVSVHCPSIFAVYSGGISVKTGCSQHSILGCTVFYCEIGNIINF